MGLGLGAAAAVWNVQRGDGYRWEKSCHPHACVTWEALTGTKISTFYKAEKDSRSLPAILLPGWGWGPAAGKLREGRGGSQLSWELRFCSAHPGAAWSVLGEGGWAGLVQWTLGR